MARMHRTLGQQAQAYLNAALLAAVDATHDKVQLRMREGEARRTLERIADASVRALTAAGAAQHYVRRAKLQALPDETIEQKTARFRGLDDIHERAEKVKGKVQGAIAAGYLELGNILALVVLKRDAPKAEYL